VRFNRLGAQGGKRRGRRTHTLGPTDASNVWIHTPHAGKVNPGWLAAGFGGLRHALLQLIFSKTDDSNQGLGDVKSMLGQGWDVHKYLEHGGFNGTLLLLRYGPRGDCPGFLRVCLGSGGLWGQWGRALGTCVCMGV
jgi:hypothetical protein